MGYSLLLQIPTDVPKPGDSGTVDLSEPFDLIVFIILPIVFVILYFVWKRNKKRDRDKNN
ncbi:adenylosuccinate synthetase [Subsaximicrobium wynnwilliamsii]|uniref:Adenylosuccinate synthetase n=1 Tax=Subsaximicrobium wynnwilliamsii TaxID=291179 RepID=A0A5C6ZH35_9FLAO|nr:adenylosuccinate synthetase [Subsaximicrobium wynnwilliamsii]TXD89011.1 adenylosuccinate synthetase [Subsaximicrobium wynnwilliamsii]TXE04006.1 adenylosuccinate synthetase [Subsaximicrobium wynnwilliamsii]